MLRKVKDWLLNNFGFSKSETNGFIILLSLMLLMLAAPLIQKWFYSSREEIGEEDQKILNELVAEINSKVKKSEPEEPERIFKLKNFDPNLATSEKLISIGLSKYVVNNISKYRQKGGKFYDKQDVRKIYGMNDSIFQAIAAFIQIAQKDEIRDIEKNAKTNNQQKLEAGIHTASEFSTQTSIPQTTLKAFDINLADTVQLKAIYGIGDALSMRIIKYRDLLGGFISNSQYQDIYGLNPDVLYQLQNFTFVEQAFEPQKIKINFMDLKSLMQHPYISYELAKKILNYRIQNGPIKSKAELYKLAPADTVIFSKLHPYLQY